ncbi:sigma factor, partial [Streptomyces sp. NPDC006356]
MFVQARPGLLKIANRIVGDAGEAEDVLQEAWPRWQRTDRSVVLNPSALPRTTTVRLALNLVQSAWKRRESCASTRLTAHRGRQPVDAVAHRRLVQASSQPPGRVTSRPWKRFCHLVVDIRCGPCPSHE